jgi:radical SAM protein with 4Fe4S-binding SPASM domain
MELSAMLINKCNCKCDFCRTVQNSTGEIMSIDNYKKILRQCQKLKILGQPITSIRLDGNREALLHPNFSELLKITTNSGFESYLITNGILLNNKNNIDDIVDNCTSINISITGVTSDVYHCFQGYGKQNYAEQFQLVVNNVRKLIYVKNQRNGKLKYVYISFIVTEKSVHQVKDAMFFWQELGVDFISFMPNARNWDKLFATAKIYYTGGGSRGHCITKAIVATNGDVFPCCQPPGEYMPLGNCFETSLSEIFNSAKYYEFASALASRNEDKIPSGCRHCGVIARIHNKGGENV